MSNFLDQAGLEYLWSKIIAKIEGASVTLPEKLVKYSAVQSISATEILNATTLGGYSASYFAKATDLTELNNTVGTHTTDITNLKNAGEVFDTTLETHTTDISGLKTDISNLNTIVSADHTTVSELDAKVADHTTNLAHLNNAIDGIPQAVSGKLDKSGGTMTGPLVAKGDSASPVAQVRNVIFSTADPTSSDGSDGDIWIKYEA